MSAIFQNSKSFMMYDSIGLTYMSKVFVRTVICFKKFKKISSPPKKDLFGWVNCAFVGIEFKNDLRCNAIYVLVFFLNVRLSI